LQASVGEKLPETCISNKAIWADKEMQKNYEKEHNLRSQKKGGRRGRIEGNLKKS